MTKLPTAHPDRPDRPVVVYDGQCPFCRKQIERIKRGDTADVFEYLPRQDEGLQQRFPQLAEGDFNTGMRLVHTDASVSVGAEAIYHIARQFKGWKYLAWIYRVPILKVVLRAAYAWVARHRGQLGKNCGDGSCKT